MTSDVYKVRLFLREIVDYYTLEGDIDHDEASFDYFRSELGDLYDANTISFNLLVKVRSRSRSRSGQ